jgi:hypothetical protein
MGLATRKDRREEKKFREEQGASEQVRSWASDMITKDPTNAHYYRMMMASPEIGIKWYDTIKGNEAREKAAEADMIRANKYEPYGGAGFGWTPDFEMSDAQFKNLDKVLSAEFGEAYSALDAEQKRYYAQQYLNAQRYGAKRGQAPGTIEVPQLPQKNPSTWDKAEDLLMRIWESVRGQANGDVGGGWTVRKK